MRIKIMPLLVAAVAFTGCNKNNDADPVQTSDQTVSVSDTGYKADSSAQNDETDKTPVTEDDVVYSDDGKILISFPADRTGIFTVPDGVEIIGEKAFYESSLTGINLPSSLIEIDRYAFRYSSLENIELNEGLKSIGASAFANTNITEIYLPDSIESCAMIFGNPENHPLIYAPAKYNDGISDLLHYENVIYRGETDLEFLLRKTSTIDRKRFEDKIFIDLDGDSFPEMIEVWSSDVHLNKFDLSSGTWKRFLSDIPKDADLHLYHDKENDIYFYICVKNWLGDKSIHKVNITENEFSDRTIGMYDTIGKNKKLYFGCFDGKFFVEENTPDICVYEMNKIMPNCELIRTVNMKDIVDKYSNDSEIYKTVMDSFADSPQPSVYKKPLPEGSKSAKAGDIILWDKYRRFSSKISADSYSVSLKSDKIIEENFEKLSNMPDLIYLHLRSFFDDDWTDDVGVGYKPSYEEMYEERTIDLSDISKLSGLEYLEIETDNITNASEISKLKNLRMLRIDGNADDLSFLADMDSLEAIQLYHCSDKPADFFAPLYGLKNLKYIIYPTDEQAAHIAENAPWINIA